MKAAQQKLSYGVTRSIESGFDETVERTIEALKEQGFGVLSEIRLDEKLKEKLGVDFRRYVILGACNPSLAYKTLQQDINIGLLLPCNVIVYESDEAGKTIVAGIDAGAMLSVVGNNEHIDETAREVNRLINTALTNV